MSSLLGATALGEDEHMEQPAATTELPENRTVQAASAPPPTPAEGSVAPFETPQRFQFVREPMTDSRLSVGSKSSQDQAPPPSPATAELEAMELERIDEEFSTPIGRSRGRRKEAASVPVRRNPRRSARNKY